MPDIYARLQDLAASAQANPAEMRPILLRVTTDMFILHAEHTGGEIRLYEEMAMKLIDDADSTTLTVVARKLARCADAPASVLNRIRAKGGEPAREIVQISRQIEWRDLRRIAAEGAWDLACALAGRSDLDREIIAILAGRPEREIARALAANALAPLSRQDLNLLAARGREDVTLAQALLRRGEITLDYLPLYLAASPEQRDLLVALVRRANLAKAGRAEATPLLDDAEAARLETSALRQKRASFALYLAEILGCDSICARRIVEDESGDALALAFVAIGLPADSAARIFLIAFPRVALSPEAFKANMKVVTTTPRRDAASIVAAVTGSAGRLGALWARSQARRAAASSIIGAHAPVLRDAEEAPQGRARFPSR